jgi:hypothetical protein
LQLAEQIASASIAEGIDRIVTLPVFNWDNMHAQIPMADFYQALKKKYGKSPLVYAAERLRQVVKQSDTVIVTTGFYVTFGETLETDGPPGAATLARALSVGLNASPVMIVEENYVESMKAICTAAGLKPFPLEKVRDGPRRIAVLGFPRDQRKAENAAETILKTVKPSGLISIECDDANKKGVYHSAGGNNITANQAKLPVLFDLANRSNVFTAGVGDFGNEIGMATLTETFEKLTPSHFKCKCGCGGGIVSTTKTEASIIANISNWGAYGLEAALALVLRNSEVMHDPLTEMRVLDEAARVGYVDPAAGFVGPTADGASRDVNASIIYLLRSAVELQESHEFMQYLS